MYFTPLLLAVGKIIREEVAALCSNRVSSVLGKTKKEDLIAFKWEKVIQEANKFAPALLTLLTTSLPINRSDTSSSVSIVGLVIAILSAYRRQSMNIVQKIVSVILYTGHCSKQVNS